MPSPKISIILPTHNRRRVLERTTAGVFAQDEKNFELIVVDDCSTDDTVTYLTSLTDERVRTLRPQKNFGTAVARNLGLDAAKADIFALLDDDDVYLDHRLSAPLSVFAHQPEVVATLSSSIKFDRKRTQVVRMPELTLAPTAFEWALMCDLIGVEGTSITARRQVALDIGGFCQGMKWIDDREFLIRASRRGSGHLIAEPLWQKYWSDDGQSNQWEQAGLSLLTYLQARPELTGRFRKLGTYLATKILVSDVRHGLFGALLRDVYDFHRAGVINGNILRMWREHREVHRYRRTHSGQEALASLTSGPDSWC